jgi:hypothetical protein
VRCKEEQQIAVFPNIFHCLEPVKYAGTPYHRVCSSTYRDSCDLILIKNRRPILESLTFVHILV